MMLSNRMTLNRRADTAAAAIVHRMMILRSPLVDLLLSPRSSGSSNGEVVAMTAGEGDDKAPTRIRNQKVRLAFQSCGFRSACGGTLGLSLSRVHLLAVRAIPLPLLYQLKVP